MRAMALDGAEGGQASRGAFQHSGAVLATHALGCLNARELVREILVQGPILASRPKTPEIRGSRSVIVTPCRRHACNRCDKSLR